MNFVAVDVETADSANTAPSDIQDFSAYLCHMARKSIEDFECYKELVSEKTAMKHIAAYAAGNHAFL